MNKSIVVSILSAAITSSGGIMFATLGEIFSQRSGVINLGLEGLMLMGGVCAYIVVVKTGFLIYGIIAALLVGLLSGLLYAFITVTLRANQIVCGLAMVIVGTGLSGFIGKDYAGAKSNISFKREPIILLSKIPFVGDIFFNQNILIYALYFFTAIAMFYIYKTRPGLRLRALGENPSVLDTAGYNVYLARYVYVMIGSMLVAAGGAYVTLAYTPGWYDQITAGIGWIAAALVIFSAWNPLKAFGGAMLFGGVSVVGLYMQVLGVEIPSFFISMLPYLSTVIVLVLSSRTIRRNHSSTPAGLGIPYDREER